MNCVVVLAFLYIANLITAILELLYTPPDRIDRELYIGIAIQCAVPGLHALLHVPVLVLGCVYQITGWAPFPMDDDAIEKPYTCAECGGSTAMSPTPANEQFKLPPVPSLCWPCMELRAEYCKFMGDPLPPGIRRDDVE